MAALRTQFLIECLADLKKNLMKRGLNLLIQQGKPEEILPTLARTFGAHTVSDFHTSLTLCYLWVLSFIMWVSNLI